MGQPTIPRDQGPRDQGKDSGYRRAEALIGRTAKAQRSATAKALAGRGSVARLLRMMKDAVARVERVVARVNKLAPPPRPIACGPGCPFCCHVRLTASPPEILLVADHLRKTWPAAKLDALKKKLANLDRLTRGKDAEPARPCGCPAQC